MSKQSISVDLTGRVMLITGASAGIGEALARSAAAGGAKVVLAARRLDRLERMAAEIEAAGGAALAVAMDVTDEASTIAAYDAAERRFGTVDTVIANAGIGHRDRATDTPMADYDRVMAINVRGVFLTVREGARRLIAGGSAEHKRGRVVIVSSITATKAMPSTVVYGASKAAALHMGRCFARDWLKLGVNVNMVLPGYIHTELTENLLSGPHGEAFIAQFPRSRVMQTEEVIPMLLYLASDAASAITGAAFTIDDGQTF
jgi:NAD(P)-dependent dehydrogenase (short-subunit alcohol dehydrogenase family)